MSGLMKKRDVCCLLAFLLFFSSHRIRVTNTVSLCYHIVAFKPLHYYRGQVRYTCRIGHKSPFRSTLNFSTSLISVFFLPQFQTISISFVCLLFFFCQQYSITPLCPPSFSISQSSTVNVSSSKEMKIISLPEN